MPKLKTYSEFLSEGIMDVLKSPIKYVKIKNNAKKLVKAKVAVALNDVNFEKKKQKSTIKDPDKNAVLTKANAAKNSALKDTAKGVSDRMDDLATSPILKKVSSLAKTKAAVAANKTILKSATGEEAKQLKVRQTELNKKATKLAGGIKDFESTAAKKEETKPAPKTDTEAKTDTEEKPAAEETPKVDDQAEDKIAQLEASIASQDKIQTDATKNIEKLKGDLKLAQDNKNTGKSSQAEADAISDKIQQYEEDRKDAKTAEAKLKKQLKPIADKQYGESFDYVAESVSEKFARLIKTI